MYKIAYDINFKIGSDFLSLFSQSKGFDNLFDLVFLFNRGLVDFAFLPVGSLPYLDTKYEIIFQALMKDNFSQFEKACFFINHLKSSQKLNDLKFGIINLHCTTSYWGLLFSLSQYLPSKAPLTLCETRSFENLVKGLIEYDFDGAMVWDKFLPQDLNPNNCFDKIEDLPTPILVSRVKPEKKLENLILNYRDDNSKCFYGGFTKPDFETIDAFLKKAKKIKNYFQIKIGDI